TNHGGSSIIHTIPKFLCSIPPPVSTIEHGVIVFYCIAIQFLPLSDFFHARFINTPKAASRTGLFHITMCIERVLQSINSGDVNILNGRLPYKIIRVIYRRFRSGGALLRGYQYHTKGGFCTVYGCRSSIFQYRNSFDICWIYILQAWHFYVVHQYQGVASPDL